MHKDLLEFGKTKSIAFVNTFSSSLPIWIFGGKMISKLSILFVSLALMCDKKIVILFEVLG